MVTTPQLSAVRTSLPRPIVVAATAFVIAGALRLTAAIEQLGLSAAYVVVFGVVAVAQISFGVLLAVGSRRATNTVVAVAAMVISLAFVGVWLVATTATVPIYPLMNSGFAVDVIDLATAILEVTSVVALVRSMPQPMRGRVKWTLIGLIAVAWLVWGIIIATNGLSD
ncbi:MAG TPA: hypothetical protein VHV74_07095 [Pseudonocardiaceae bacterium]|jgi:hypothetical protein|nr:hypothetical protein [Pseudonocardiaceae bacterium]